MLHWTTFPKLQNLPSMKQMGKDEKSPFFKLTKQIFKFIWGNVRALCIWNLKYETKIPQPRGGLHSFEWYIRPITFTRLSFTTLNKTRSSDATLSRDVFVFSHPRREDLRTVQFPLILSEMYRCCPGRCRALPLHSIVGGK